MRIRTFLLAVPLLLLACAASRGQTPVLAWDAEASAARPAQADVYRGETVALRPAFLERGAPADTNGAAFTLYWQTNGMGAAWWSDPADAFRWTPARDCGAAAYTLFIRCDTAAGASYRANARLRMLDSPGAVPNALPLPAASLDFARLTVLNPPWPSAADLQAASNALAAAVQPLGPRLDLIEGGTNAWQTAYSWGDHALAGYLSAATWQSWLGTNTYVQTESDKTALAALASYAATNNGVPYTGAAKTVNIGNNDLIVSNDVHVGDDVIVGGHIEVDGRINLLGSNRYIDGLAPIADWSSSQAASAASVSSMVAGEYLPRDADIPGAISMAYWQYIGADMAGLSVGQAFIGETVLFPQGVGFYSDAAALWRASEHYAIPLGPSSPLATQLDVSLATNAIVQTYFLGTNAWMIVSNDVLRIWQISPTNSLQTNLLWQSGDAFPPAATQTLWQAILQLTQDVDGKAPAAWGNYAPDGSDNPDPAYMTFLNAPAAVFASGAQWSTYGTYAVLTATGTVAFAAGSDGQLRIGPNSTNWFGYVQGDSVTVGAAPGSLTVVNGGAAGGYAEIVYPYAGGDFPTLWFTPSLALDFTEVGGAVWIDNLDGTATATAPAESASGFWYATTTSVIDTYFMSTMPARLDGGVIGATNAVPVVYDSVITVTSGGKTYRIPAQEVLP